MSRREAEAIVAADGVVRVDPAEFPQGTTVRVKMLADPRDAAARLPADLGAEHGRVEFDADGRRLPYAVTPHRRLGKEAVARGERLIEQMRSRSVESDKEAQPAEPADWEVLTGVDEAHW